VQYPARFVAGGVHRAQLAGRQVDGVDAALEPDWVLAQAGALGLADFLLQLGEGERDAG
jgi:hypothetical protein